MNVRIKICGITRRRDAEAAVEMGADFLGFNFYPKSPRCVDPSLVRSILAGLPRAAAAVGVFVNEDAARITAVMEASGLGIAQLHGDEPPELCAALPFPVIKALRLGTAQDLEAAGEFSPWALLVDSKTPVFGGSGERPDLTLAAAAKKFCNRLILAGGLTPENVAAAVAAVGPWAVDVASGVESAPGIKDEDKMRRFIEAVKNVSG
ncbi:MAG TPA: phosphoribosylanthranilate isomerase [bacterium]|nr:phosphoribosylanthranilate isomerase [bacterium]